MLFNLPSGDWGAGERGIACHRDRVDEFREGVLRAIEYASALGNKQINCLAGIVPKDAQPDHVHETLVANLVFAAEKLKSAGIRLIVEPINTFDIPGFALSTSQQTIDIISETGADIGLQYDIYHMQRMEGELANTLKRLMPRIAHVQIADTPGRNEPGTGEINYPFLFRHLDELGYSGWIGCEYKPLNETRIGLGWMTRLL